MVSVRTINNRRYSLRRSLTFWLVTLSIVSRLLAGVFYLTGLPAAIAIALAVGPWLEDLYVLGRLVTFTQE